MGQQIAVAQDRSDEDAAMNILRAHGDLLALPRSHTRPAFKAVPAGQCDAQFQILVPKSNLDAVLTTVHESRSKPGHFSVDFSTTSGMFIEWDRTYWVKPDVAEAGRFYLARAAREHGSESIAAVTSAMTAIQRFIRSRYPARSDGRHRVHIGPSTWERMERGEVRILSSAGEEVNVTPVRKSG